jgi:succinyl-CoA synthetase beta subunit
VVALRNVAWWSDVTRTAAGGLDASPGPVPVPAAAERRGRWSEATARHLLSAAGVPVVPACLAGSADEAVKAAASIGGPLAIKIVAAEIVHKSDIGGVRLNVAPDEAAVRQAYLAVTAAAASARLAAGADVLISPMRTGGVELLVGVVTDPQWGPMLAVAVGGIFVEVLRDSVLAPLPVTPERARRMLGSLRGRPLLDGVRGGAPADLAALSAVIARIGDLAVALGENLESLEVNPLWVDGARIEALDAVVTWTSS